MNLSVDYLVASLPTLTFGADAPMSYEKFEELVPNEIIAGEMRKWEELETQLRNAMAEARNGESFRRPTNGCSLYWKNRVLACFQEHDVGKRDENLDRVWWQAAAELTPPTEPLGKGALATYAVRLKIAIRRSLISKSVGNEQFDLLTAESKMEF